MGRRRIAGHVSLPAKSNIHERRHRRRSGSFRFENSSAKATKSNKEKSRT
jgi:hypothetical protein